MRASIIAVGTELLFGQTINTNATFLSHELNTMGFDVMYNYVVGDNKKRLLEILDKAFSDTDLVVLTGGLGPTQDDITKETVAEYMQCEMHLDENVVQNLHKFYDDRGKVMPENNIKQAYIPNGAIPIYNDAGTAPGIIIERNKKTAICFPGPPNELRWLYNHGVHEYLMNLLDSRMYYKIIRTIGIGESDLEMKLMPLIDKQSDPTIATYAKEGECTIRVASKRDTLDEAKLAVRDMINSIDDIIGEYIYSYDNEDLTEVVINLLRDKKYTISSAESCTGGMFASTITDIAGASDVFRTSFVTYQVDSKTSDLNISEELIDTYGVVSDEVALSMAMKTMEKTGSNIAISITGYAGPNSEKGHEPGEAYIGYAYKKTDSSGNDIKNGVVPVMTSLPDRARNRRCFVTIMLQTVYYLLKDKI